MDFTLSRLFPRRQDPIDRQLADLAHQGSAMAGVAHMCASMLVVLFSAGSLVALGSDALSSILRQWSSSHTLDIPGTISVLVSFLMVTAMDVGLLYAASMLRVLAARRAGLGDRWVHLAVMVVVSVLEASTYAYMSFRFEAPSSPAAEGLILARACAAPLLAVYLSMARPLPITDADILGQVELAAGRGVLRDVTQAANDQTAPLERKMRLYGAAAHMAPANKTRLDNMIAAVCEDQLPLPGHIMPALALTGLESAPARPYDDHQSPLLLRSPDAPERPPTGPGSPTVAPVRTPKPSAPKPGTIKLVPERQPRKIAARAGRHPKESVEAKVRAAYVPGMSVGDLERAAGVSRSSANRWRIVLERELRAVQ